MNDPYFETIATHTIKPREKLLEDDLILVQSNGEYLRVAVSNPTLSCQRKIIQIPIETLLLTKGCF